MKLQSGQTLPSFLTQDIIGNQIDSKQLKGKKLYLTFLRNTACPLCSFHVFRLLKMADQLRERNVEIIAFYESKRQVILSSPFFKEKVIGEKKLIVISDPERKLYNRFGTEINAEKATFDILQKNGRLPIIEAATKAGFIGDGIQEGTNAEAIPADFLVDENQNIIVAHYGIDSGDNISLDEVDRFSIG